MDIRKIALKNLLRRRGKAAFVLAGLVIGVATVVGVATYIDSMTAEINDKLEKYGANILIVPKTDNLSLSYGGITLGGVAFEMQEIRQGQLASIKDIKNADSIAAVGPIVLGAVNSGSQRILLAGVDFKATSILKPWWKVSGSYPGSNQLLLGAEASRVLGVGRGDEIEIDKRHLPVAGVLHPTGSQDDQLIFTDLETAQNLLGKVGIVSMVEVAALCNACPITDMVAQLSAALPMAKVMAIQKVVKSRMETLGQFRRFSFGISAVVALVGGLVVLVTLMGSVRERRREIGIFRAIGFRRAHIMRIIFFEAGLISLLAGAVGYGVGMGGAWLALKLFGSHTGGIAPDPVLASNAVAMAVIVGLTASIYPALAASRLDPNEALRSL